MDRYFHIKDIHVFISLSLKSWSIQIGTVKKSYHVEVSYGRVYWHNGLFTLSIIKNLHLMGAPEYDDPSNSDNWGCNDWSFHPFLGFRKKFPISSGELILNELIGENDWDYISRRNDLTFQQLEEFRDQLNWNIISYRYKLDYEFIRRNKDKIVWDELKINKKIPKRLKQKVLKNIFENYI